MSASPVLASSLARVVGPDATLVGADTSVADLFHDSRDVVPGTAFVAVRGANTDGHAHIGAAVSSGANLVVVDHEVGTAATQLVVGDTRAVMARLAAEIHGRPADKLPLIGVTGTNGKTTITHIIESMINAAGGTPGIIGTIGAHIGGEVLPHARTTPEATDLQRMLRAMVEGGVTGAALEVSSHALVLGRADEIVFDVAVFTNLTQDHLDFHVTMEDYFLAKARLFTPDHARTAVIWVDDAAGERLAGMTTLPVDQVGFGASGHDVWGEVKDSDSTHSVIALHLEGAEVDVRMPVAGRFNAANAILAAAAAHRIGLPVDAIAAGIEGMPQVPGRFERVPNELGLTVVVDYAHTPDAVANAISAAARVTRGRTIAVVGSAGDRDPEKRIPMGEAAATADVAVVTSDNPRSEDPDALVAQVLEGTRGSAATVIAEVDRRTAIRRAVEVAQPQDMVLILGKGHEPYQEFATETIDFDDRQVAAEEMARISQGGSDEP